MIEFKTGDRFQINDGQQPPIIVEVEAVHDRLVQTITHMTTNYKTVKRKGGQHKDTFQQLIDNGYLTKI